MLHNADGLGSFSSSSLPRLRQRRGLAVQGKSQIPPMDGELFGHTFIVNPVFSQHGASLLVPGYVGQVQRSHGLVPELRSSVRPFTSCITDSSSRPRETPPAQRPACLASRMPALA